METKASHRVENPLQKCEGRTEVNQDEGHVRWVVWLPHGPVHEGDGCLAGVVQDQVGLRAVRQVVAGLAGKEWRDDDDVKPLLKFPS